MLYINRGMLNKPMFLLNRSILDEEYDNPHECSWFLLIADPIVGK